MRSQGQVSNKTGPLFLQEELHTSRGRKLLLRTLVLALEKHEKYISPTSLKLEYLKVILAHNSKLNLG